MRSVDDQLALITDAAVTPEPVRIAIANSLGLMCAEEVQANQPLPGFLRRLLMVMQCVPWTLEASAH